MPAEDEDFEAWVARFTQGLESGEIQVPAERFVQGMRFELAGTDDPAVLEPEAFSQDRQLDQAEPGAVLAAQAAAVAGEGGALGAMSDDALLGLVAAGRRLAGRAAAIQQRAVAEYARRRVPAPGSRVSRKGFTEFSADELAWQLVVNHNQAEAAMDLAANAERRLPKCCGLLWGGQLTDYQLKIITWGTRCLTDEGASEADQILAASAPGLTPGQTRALVARVVLMIDPEAAKDRKRDAAKQARVEKFQELSGTAALCGRDLPADAVLASYQHIDAQARMLKAAGFREDLEKLRAAVYLALLTGRNPETMLTALKSAAGEAVPVPDRDPQPGSGPADGWWPRGEPAEPENRPAEPENHQNGEDETGEDRDGEDGTGEGEGGSRREPDQPHGPAGGQPASPGYGTEGTGSAPFAAIINLQVPAATLYELGTAPGEIPGYGPVDPETTRDLVQAASAHPATRWCVTTIGTDGTAQEHGCSAGQHRWTPPAPARTSPARHRTGGGNRDGPHQPPEPQDQGPGDDQDQLQLAAAGFLTRLQVKLAPIATGTQDCDHQHCTQKYEVPKGLKHLVRTRKPTCVAPGCNWPAADGDADHTIPWPQGPTCQENLGTPCRYHHRNKQANGWKLQQPTPGQFQWQAPSGRTHTTTPATYLT